MSGLPTVTPLASISVSKTGSGTSTQTIALGTAAATRRIFLLINSYNFATLSSISITPAGGSAIPLNRRALMNFDGADRFAVYEAVIPTGTSGTLTIVRTGTIGWVVGSYSVLDLDDPTGFSAAVTVATSKTVPGSIACPANGFIFGFLSATHSTGSTPAAPTWTGLTVDSALNVISSNSNFAWAHKVSAAAITQAVSTLYNAYFTGSTSYLVLISFGNGDDTITGSLAVTEDRDTSAISGNSVVTGTLALTEARDTIDATGATYNPGLSVTEAPDIVDFEGVLLTTGTLAVTEAPDVPFFSNRNVGTLAIHEAPDTVAIAAEAFHPQSYFDRVIEAQLSGATMRAAHLVWFDFLSGGQGLWPGFGPIEAAGLTFDGLANLGSVSAITGGAGGVAQEVTFTLAGSAGLLADIQGDAEQAAGRDVRVYLQFFQVDHVDEWGNWVDWQQLGDPMVVFWGSMGPLKATQAIASDASDPKFSRAVSTTAVNAFFNRGRPAFGFYSDRDQKSRSPGDNMFSQVTGLVDATTKWPNF